MSYRIDIGSLRPPQVLPDGRLRCDGALTRTGVFVYRNADGTERREYRPPEEVFRADSLLTFALAPITNGHPAETVTAENARTVTVGMVGESVKEDEGFVIAPLMIFDAATIADIQAGKTQLSCGYQADVIFEEGITDAGERYDAIQKNIRGNHVALVDIGRAGPEAAIRMDDAALMIEGTPHKDETKMDEELKNSIKKIAELEAAQATLEGERDAEKARADRSEGERDAAIKQTEAAEKAKQDTADSLDACVTARVALESKAYEVLGREDGDGDKARSFAGLSDRAVQELVVVHVDGADAIPEGKGDEYVEARFDAAVKNAKGVKDAHAGLRQAINQSGRKDAPDADEARARMIARQEAACKPAGQE